MDRTLEAEGAATKHLSANCSGILARHACCDGSTRPRDPLAAKPEPRRCFEQRGGRREPSERSTNSSIDVIEEPFKPNRAELLAAAGKTVPDVITPRLRVLFCGINPGLYSAATGHHFARPGNRFWPALHGARFTDRRLTPWEERELLRYRCGVTNLVARATASANELSTAELTAGRRRLLSKVKRYAPRFVAVLGIGAYRSAFDQPKATMGRQRDSFGNATVWVLPNPSGLNAHHQLKEIIGMFRALRRAAAD